MLERTAASIEPCGLHRVLPSAARASMIKGRGRRPLQTTFWNHGASDIELLDACQALVRMPFHSSNGGPPSAAPAKPERRLDPMTASSFLLDFLYPTGAAALLRRLLPASPERFDPAQKLSRPGARLYTSPASGRDEQPHRTALSASQDALRVFLVPKPIKEQREVGAQSNELEDQEAAGQVLDKEGRLLPQDLQHAAESPETESPETLRKLLASGQTEAYDQVWELYARLDPKSSNELRRQVLLHLGQSSRPQDAQRVYELFFLFPTEEWTEYLVRAVLRAFFILDNREAAMEIFTRAIQQRGLINLLDDMLAHYFKISAWDMVRKTMKAYSTLPPGSPSTVKLPQLAATPFFLFKLGKCYRSQKMAGEEVPPDANELDLLLKLVATNSLALFEVHDAIAILRRAQDATAYETFIRLCVDQRNTKLASQMYKKYRMLSDVRVHKAILRLMLDIYYPHDVLGMETVLKDWYRHYGVLDLRAYQKFIAFYAANRDLKAVSHFAAEYRRHYPFRANTDASLLSSEMKVHAARCDPKAARSTMDAAEQAAKLKSEPSPVTTIHWNIYLDAFAKAGEYDGAIKAFSHICDERSPDGYTFGTMMGMAGSRGDLQFTLELFKLANEKGIPSDTALIDAVIEAYCQNDRFAEAEMLCLKMTRRKRHRDMVCTTLWNTLLFHHAERRDLSTVNRLLETMSQHQVPYDSNTYTHLLSALLYCKQSHHAYHFIRIVSSEGIFQPSAEHYTLLMSAFLHSHEPHMALKVNTLMSKMHLPDSAARAEKVIQALSQWREMPLHLREGDEGANVLITAMKTFQVLVVERDRKIPDSSRSTTAAYSRMLFLLTQMREFTTARWLIGLHDRVDPNNVPVRLLHSIMLADYYEMKFDAVKSTWDLVLERTMRQSMPPPSLANISSDPPQVFPAYRYSLSDPLKTMQRMYTVQEKPEALMALIAHVRAMGFELDSKNWNYYVQALAQLKKWKEAFAITEERLMPQWRGWHRVRVRENQKNEIPLEVRRLSSSRREVRPISHTLIILTKEYIDLEQMALWSKAASSLFDKINTECPKTVRAITTMVRSDSEFEAEVFSGQRAAAVRERDFGYLKTINKETTEKPTMVRPDSKVKPEVSSGQRATVVKQRDPEVLESGKETTAKPAMVHPDSKVEPEVSSGQRATAVHERDSRVLESRKETTATMTMDRSDFAFKPELLSGQRSAAVHERDPEVLKSRNKEITTDDFRAQLLGQEAGEKHPNVLPRQTKAIKASEKPPTILERRNEVVKVGDRHVDILSTQIQVIEAALVAKKKKPRKKRRRKEKAMPAAQPVSELEKALLVAHTAEKKKEWGEVTW
ncbi:hypothetical protein B0T22DRAFT_459519 [Podospora appendiculata]|uniref:Uncharacterized protein n=1 Tax=Podospora appendiculata TaxID=314037 RepID=A0AAE0X9Q8_9PEZI|nr:hypothetical protein B0T22DRAFT_459519 [Podospora appendiculata]